MFFLEMRYIIIVKNICNGLNFYNNLSFNLTRLHYYYSY